MTLKLLVLLLLQICNSPCSRCGLSLLGWFFSFLWCWLCLFWVGRFCLFGQLGFVSLRKPILKFTHSREGVCWEWFLTPNLWPHKISGIVNQPASKKAAVGRKKQDTLSWAKILHVFTHLLFLSFPGFLLLQFYLLWKKFSHYLVRNTGVQIPKGKDIEEED